MRCFGSLSRAMRRSPGGLKPDPAMVVLAGPAPGCVCRPRRRRLGYRARASTAQVAPPVDITSTAIQTALEKPHRCADAIAEDHRCDDAISLLVSAGWQHGRL